MTVNELYHKLVEMILDGNGDALIKVEDGDLWQSIYDTELISFEEDEEIKLLILK